MTENERLDLLDLLLNDAPIWADDEELRHFDHATLRWWLDRLGHPKAHAGCCETCGCATTCVAAAFYTAVVSSTVRQLDAAGALAKPVGGHVSNTGGPSAVSAGAGASGWTQEAQEG